MPSILDGLFAGRSGIASHGTAISVLSDNIANSNTTGFKSSRADFADILAGNLSGGGTAAAGSGSRVVGITPLLTQGSFEFTGRGLDTGIDGKGFFVVEDSNGAGQRFYTRAGNFKIDTEGYVLNQNNYRVMGFPSSGAGGLDYLNVNDRSQTSVATDLVTIGGNLDSSQATTTVPAGSPTFEDLNNAANFSTFVSVYDTLGSEHTATVYFFKTAANTWQAKAYVDAGEVGGTDGDPSLLGSLTLAFGSDGQLSTPTANTMTVSPAWDNGSDATTSIDFTFDPISQFAAASAIDNISQNGTGSGSVVGFSIEKDGTLFAQLDNGQTANIGTVALANFANAEALRRNGESLFQETVDSGVPVVGRPGTGTYGSLESGALELSNADSASDFIRLISLQRGFQGSSRIIQSINQLLSDLVNIVG